jgi:hypothetical protein
MAHRRARPWLTHCCARLPLVLLVRLNSYHGKTITSQTIALASPRSQISTLVSARFTQPDLIVPQQQPAALAPRRGPVRVVSSTRRFHL